VALLLHLARQNGSSQRISAVAGQYQQSLSNGRNVQLVRLALPAGSPYVPEITGYRLMISVRMLALDAQGRYRPTQDDVDFELALCAWSYSSNLNSKNR
jgi:cell division protein ZapD